MEARQGRIALILAVVTATVQLAACATNKGDQPEGQPAPNDVVVVPFDATVLVSDSGTPLDSTTPDFVRSSLADFTRRGMRVDTLIVTPTEITLRVGDQFPYRDSVTVVGLDSMGVEIHQFTRLWRLHGAQIARLERGRLVAQAPGETQLLLETTFGEAGGSPRRPFAAIRVVIRR